MRTRPLIHIVVALLTGASSAFAKTPPKPAHIVSEQQARATALDAYSGKVNSGELEYEGGHWVYSFDIEDRSEPRKIHEIQVDAASGKVVSTAIETPQREQHEQSERH
jgi:uncharacterized membrane protein YkoI